MTVWGLQDQLAEVIDMLLDRHPMGLRVLTGEAPPPTQEEVHLMYQAGRIGDDPGVRVGNPGTPPSPRMDQVLMDKQKFDKIIERSGGWVHLPRWQQRYKALRRSDRNHGHILGIIDALERVQREWEGQK